MQTLKQIIETQGAQIAERWAEHAKKTASARALSRPELFNIMLAYLASLVVPDGPELGRRQLELVEEHVASRLRHGFDLVEVQQEFALLGRCILQAWAAVPLQDRPDVNELDNVLEIVHQSTVLVSDMYVRHLLEDAQSEKRFFRLIRQTFTEPPTRPERGQPALSDRLNAALPIVMESLDATTVAMMLLDPETEQLVMTASAGAVDEHLTHHAQSLATTSFGGLTASREEPTTILDVVTTELEVPEHLRHSGIHALLGARVPLQRQLIGVLYVGIREVRPFSARERRRIEAIAEHLALLIENAQLNLELEKQISSLRAERKVRESVASILAHDIRGPLSAARAAAEMLARTEDEAKRLHWITVILRSLDRGARMVSDLLDAERIHAGQNVPLSREPSDLAAIVREVVEELSIEHGDRFVVDVPKESITGCWGREELRRAIWNLATNALKYGSTNTPVRLSIRALPKSVEVDVHNEGAPIPIEQQAGLFEPFVQARHERSVPRGWGLGLAVVRGVAEAHGGSVAVDSGADRGTTFTMRITRA